MTQSCDLAIHHGKSKLDDVILAAVYRKSELKEAKPFHHNDGWRMHRKGKYPGYHVLNKCEIAGHELDFLLVDLRRIFTLSVDAVGRSPLLRARKGSGCCHLAGSICRRHLLDSSCALAYLQIFRLSNKEPPLRLFTVEVLEAGTHELVTAIEILSPVNKQPGREARDEYLHERRVVAIVGQRDRDRPAARRAAAAFGATDPDGPRTKSF